MIPSLLVQTVLNAVLGGGRKQSRRAARFLTGRHSSLWANPAVLMTAAGVAWGVVESLRQHAGAGTAQPATGSPRPDSGPPLRAHGGTVAASEPLAPLPVTAEAPVADDGGLRMIRLAVSAATADGALNDRERAAIVQQAKDAGLAETIERELRNPRPVAEIVSGVTDPGEAATLYVLAFTILRADEQLTTTEQIYLAQLAHLLALDRGTVERLEKDTGERIDALGDQGQPGG
jgi:hypothetical protein